MKIVRIFEEILSRAFPENKMPNTRIISASAFNNVETN
jgi:hypothetical protein